MAVIDQCVKNGYALYNSDCIELMQSLPAASVHLSVYSPPFAGLYIYSSSERDLSNAKDYPTFMEHYGFVVAELARVTMPGRMTAVHVTDIPMSNSGTDAYLDFPGDVIRLHERLGWKYAGSHYIWKEPLAVRLRTMQKNLAHATVVKDSIDCGVAAAERLLLFRNAGDNPVPVDHPIGLMDYAGDDKPPAEVLRYRGWAGNQIENRFSHWIWRQYADSMWHDVRIQRVLPYVEARESEDEKHVHPLQLDVIDRVIVLRTNPGEVVLTPFMGVGSEVYSAVRLGRKAIGAELKASYYRQAVKNVAAAESDPQEQHELLLDEEAA